MNSVVGRLIRFASTVTYGLVAPVVIVAGFNGIVDVLYAAIGLIALVVVVTGLLWSEQLMTASRGGREWRLLGTRDDPHRPSGDAGNAANRRGI